ncbi:MAG: SdrD B-like domain-containing protein, partial [bacterium]
MKGRIGNFAWHDQNGNGIQDSGEPGLDNVGVTLIGTDGFGNDVNRMSTTDNTGHYVFDDITPGTYRVGFGLPAGGYSPTAADRGSNEAADSDYGPMGIT